MKKMKIGLAAVIIFLFTTLVSAGCFAQEQNNEGEKNEGEFINQELTTKYIPQTDYFSSGIIFLSIGAMLISSSCHYVFRVRRTLENDLLQHANFLSSCESCIQASESVINEDTNLSDEITALRNEMDEELKQIRASYETRIETNRDIINKIIGGVS